MKTIIVIASLCSAALVTGCNTVPTDMATTLQDAPKKEIKITVEPDRAVMITNTYLTRHNNELNVSGVLRPKSAAVRTAGHIHVSFLGVDDVAIRHLKVEPSNAFFRQSLVKNRFNASMALDAASGVSEVHLKHHDGPLEACSYQAGGE